MAAKIHTLCWRSTSKDARHAVAIAHAMDSKNNTATGTAAGVRAKNGEIIIT